MGPSTYYIGLVHVSSILGRVALHNASRKSKALGTECSWLKPGKTLHARIPQTGLRARQRVIRLSWSTVLL